MLWLQKMFAITNSFISVMFTLSSKGMSSSSFDLILRKRLKSIFRSHSHADQLKTVFSWHLLVQPTGRLTVSVISSVAQALLGQFGSAVTGRSGVVKLVRG